MRTTIDMPDVLFKRAKAVMVKRNMTFRSLVIDALEKSLNEKPETFVLRDESAGYSVDPQHRKSSREINRALDDIREPKSES